MGRKMRELAGWPLFSLLRRGSSSLPGLWRPTAATSRRVSFSAADNGEDELIQSSKLRIFDRHLKRKQRDRAAWLIRPNDSLVDSVAENLLDRLEDCKKTFPTALFLGGSIEAIRRLLRGHGKFLEAKYPHLYWTPCAAHCLDLILEDIFKIPRLQTTFEKAIAVHGYIYNRPGLLNMMRTFTNLKNLVKQAKTRFSTAFLTLQRMHSQKKNLRKMIISDEWHSSKWIAEPKGKAMAATLMLDSFWNNVVFALKISGPLVKVLRLVDNEKQPPMGYIYEAMDRAKEAIEEAFNFNLERYKQIFELIDNRWNLQLHRPLHAAGYFLNPEYFYERPEVMADKEVMEGFYQCVERLVPIQDVQDTITREISEYKNGEGLFGRPLAIRQRKTRSPGAIEKLTLMDSSYDMVKLCKDTEQDMSNKTIETSFVVGDEEFLPVKESSVDLVISCLGLHWTNDLPGAMIQCRRALKPDGLFLASIFGGETLRELRIACTVAQMEREGGISPRLSPLAQVRDAGNLLTRAGFTLPGVDVDEYTVKYKSALELIEHLRAMGETNALLQRNNMLKRETALATAAVYESMFAAEDGTVPATFQVIYMTGWREHHTQQKARTRGSATVSFKDIQEQLGGGSSN